MSQTNLKSISYLKHHTADLVEQVTKQRQPTTITQNGEAKVVVLDVHTYQAWRRALALSKLMSMSERDIADGKISSTDKAFARAEIAITRTEDASD